MSALPPCPTIGDIDRLAVTLAKEEEPSIHFDGDEEDGFTIEVEIGCLRIEVTCDYRGPALRAMYGALAELTAGTEVDGGK